MSRFPAFFRRRPFSGARVDHARVGPSHLRRAVSGDGRRRRRRQPHRQRDAVVRELRLFGATGNVHRAGAVRVHICRRRRRQRVAGDDIRPAQAHDQRAQYLHTEPGAGRPVGPVEQHTVHVHRLHGTKTLLTSRKVNTQVKSVLTSTVSHRITT